MEKIQADISESMQAATMERIRQYKQLQGKQVGQFPFWDIVVIGAMDNNQRVAYELQLQEKLAKGQLPLGVDYSVVADPGKDKIGGGGSMMAILACLHQIYKKHLLTKKVLILPAGGYSQRLPNASVLGKMFLSMPLGDPLYQMFDLKLALTINFPAKMSAGLFLAASDSFELYAEEDSSDWSFHWRGVTALGHPSPVSIGTGHGVFVVPARQASSASVEVVAAKEFLHKPNVEAMRKKEAVLDKDFCSSIGEEGEMVLTDSSYYMDFSTAMKLLELYKAESPLCCEIDCHGDFMQPLGPRATSEYINNLNVSRVTPSLLSMRQKIFDVLKGTPLNVAVMKHSRFYHIGTIHEYLDHICNLTPLAKELGLRMYKQDNSGNSNNNTVDPSSKKGSRKQPASSCVMSSICPKKFNVGERTLVEHCDFQIPVTVGSNSIVSCCRVGTRPDGAPVTVSPDTFLHTACIADGKRQYVTVAFGINDDLKKVCNMDELSIFGKSVKDLCRTGVDVAETCLFPRGSTRSLWHAKLFQPADKMAEAFHSTTHLMETLLGESPWQPTPNAWEGRLSMADIIQLKDIFGMLEFRQKLAEIIKDSSDH